MKTEHETNTLRRALRHAALARTARTARTVLMALTLLILVLTVWHTEAQAAVTKTTKAASYDLTNVKKADKTAGEWVKTAKGYRYRLTDGTWLKSRWLKNGGSIYYLNKSGYRTSGWVSYRGSWYLLRSNGTLKTGWHGHMYLKKSDGTRASGFLKIKGRKYCFSPDTGTWQSGVFSVSGSLYYADPSTGVIKTGGWFTAKNKAKYYARSSGALATGWTKIDGLYYRFSDKGVLLTKEGTEINPDGKMVALTFDDGPGPYTERLLKCLKNNNARATFFMVGTSVTAYPSVVAKVSEAGCEIGNHSWSHPNMLSVSSAEVSSQISRTSAAIVAAGGTKPKLCRLPYGSGAWTGWVLSAAGLPSIYWSIDTRDWANRSNPQHTVSAVLNYVQDGDIVLMHDIHQATVTAAETIIPALIRRGYQLVTVSELAQFKGVTLKTGNTYRSIR